MFKNILKEKLRILKINFQLDPSVWVDFEYVNCKVCRKKEM